MKKVEKHGELISNDIREIIRTRYKIITKAINREFWNSNSETDNSLYVGSYGRGTAIDCSDVDIVVILPKTEFDRVNNSKNNSQSYLLRLVKDTILDSYPRSDIHADGQVVVINFSDGIRFEVVPVFKKINYLTSNDEFIYPDTNNGGRWQSTNPKAEQIAMNEKNNYYHSNGLLKDTCKHIRRIKNEFFSSYHLSGILIDSFVYQAIGDWHWLRDGEVGTHNTTSYEEWLYQYYNQSTFYGVCSTRIFAPGSGMVVDTKDWEILGKVLKKMVE